MALTPQQGSTSPVHDADLGERQTDAPCVRTGRPVLDGVLAIVGLHLRSDAAHFRPCYAAGVTGTVPRGHMASGRHESLRGQFALVSWL